MYAKNISLSAKREVQSERNASETDFFNVMTLINKLINN